MYWKKVRYSYWKEKQSLNWCKRNVKLGARLKHDTADNSTLPQGTCNANNTCVCSTEKEKEKAKKADRDAYSFLIQFKQDFNTKFFTKPKPVDEGNFKRVKSKKGFTKLSKSKSRPQKRRKFFSSLSSGFMRGLNLNRSRVFTQSDLLKLLAEAKKKQKKPINMKPRGRQSKKPNIELRGNVFSLEVNNLLYFQNYIFMICACTSYGCAKPQRRLGIIHAPCAITQASTDSNKTADDINGPVNATVNDDIFYNISWNPPKSPNAVVLKYEILVTHDQDEEYSSSICVGSSSSHRQLRAQYVGAQYTAKVRAISPAGNGSWSAPCHFYIHDSKKEKDQILVVGVSVGCAVIVVFMFAIVLYYALFQRNIARGAPGVLYASVNPEYINSSEVYIPDEWELDREKIELGKEIGQGSFGKVFEGIAHDVNGILESRVAVKTVNENASIRDRIQFLQEASIMKAFKSIHVTKLIGVVSQGQPTFVVMELMAGDLQSFLRNRRPEDHPSLPLLTRGEIILMVAQIADGMAYLSARKYVHRDLAARNCFIGFDNTVKIGDFGLARDIYETDYYRKGGKGLLPVRWMAPESLKDGIFTTASDVWSYGVVIWEIVTYALQPYQGKSNEELLHFVTTGGCLKYPDDCDDLMKQIMDLCWQSDPQLRPHFLELVRIVEDDCCSADFRANSFYHEMKRKAIDDHNMCLNGSRDLHELLGRPKDGDLHDLLGRPSSTKSKTKGKLGGSKTCGSLSSVDSGAYIENCKPEADQTPELPLRKQRSNNTELTSSNNINNNNSSEKEETVLNDDDDDETFLVSSPLTHVPVVPPFQRSESFYDNDSDVNMMTYGDTPVHRRHQELSSDDEGDDDDGELKISKIFFGKPVPV